LSARWCKCARESPYSFSKSSTVHSLSAVADPAAEDTFYAAGASRKLSCGTRTWNRLSPFHDARSVDAKYSGGESEEKGGTAVAFQAHQLFDMRIACDRDVQLFSWPWGSFPCVTRVDEPDIRHITRPIRKKKTRHPRIQEYQSLSPADHS